MQWFGFSCCIQLCYGMRPKYLTKFSNLYIFYIYQLFLIRQVTSTFIAPPLAILPCLFRFFSVKTCNYLYRCPSHVHVSKTNSQVVIHLSTPLWFLRNWCQHKFNKWGWDLIALMKISLGADDGIANLAKHVHRTSLNTPSYDYEDNSDTCKLGNNQVLEIWSRWLKNASCSWE